MFRNTTRAAGAAVAAALAAAPAHADTIITFSGLEHGRIVTDQFAGLGVTIAADNPNRSFDLAAIFDSQRTGTADPDLEGPPWSRGNLAPNTVLGNLLIIAENNRGSSDGVLDDPDDEGNRPGGDLIFTFSAGATVFGLDLVDIEGVTDELGELRFFRSGQQVGVVSFAAFVTSGNAYYDPTVRFGDRSANRIAPIAASAFGVSRFDRVVVHLGGSGAVDNIVIPAPSAAGLLALGALGLARRRR